MNDALVLRAVDGPDKLRNEDGQIRRDLGHVGQVAELNLVLQVLAVAA